MFFKIESWNCQVQFEIEFHETLQNFNSIGQLIKKMKIKLNELKVCEVSRILISNWTWKFQLSILKNKKVLFLKKFFLSRTTKIDPKDGVSRLNFPEGFDFPLAIFPADVIYECPTLGLVFPDHLGPTMSFFRC